MSPLGCCLLFLSLAAAVFAADRKNFDIPAGTADRTLKQFTAQSGAEVVYAAEIVRGVQTPAVKGEMTSSDALRQLLADTVLTVRQDERGTTFMISRGPNGPGPAPEKPKVTADAPVELSPFVVNTDADDGWLAGTTMLSTRTNQELKDVPVSIDALTKEFLLDVGAFDAFAAAEWIANASVSTENSGVGVGAPASATDPPPDSNRYAFRGIANEAGPTRNLFSWFVPSDTYNVERIDFGRGSNSLLFGDVEPGGQGNIYTKRAVIGRSFGNVLTQIGSFDTYRGNFDYNRTVGRKLALRLNATHSHSERDFDFNEFELDAVHGAVTYRPFKNTIVRGEFERGAYSRVWGTNRQTIQERSAPGLGFSSQWVVLADNSVVRNSTLPAIDRQGAPTGETLSLLDKDPGGFPRHYNWFGADQASDRRFRTHSLYLEQRVREVNVELSFNHQLAEWDEIQMRGNYLVRTDGNGRRYIDFTLTDRFVEQEQMTVRGMATYNWEPAPWFSQQLIASAELRESDFITDLYHEKNERATTGALNGNAARINYRIYVDDPGAYNPALLGRRATLPESPTFRRISFIDSGRGEASWARAYSVSANGKYFNGRLQSMLGTRLDTAIALESTPWLNANRTPRGERVPITKYDETPERYTAQDARSNVEEPSHTAGLVYKLNSNVSLYGVYSTSFRAANGSAVDFSGDLIGQQHGETIEFGLKSDFFNRKMVVNLTWYDLRRSNVDFQYEQAGITEDELEDLFNPAALGATAADYVTVNGRREQRMQFSRGFESTVIFYPGRGWNVRLAGAYKDVTQDESMPRFKELLARAIARGGENPAYIAAAQNIIAQYGADGREVAARYAAPLTFNFATNYRFGRDSRFRDFSLGLNGAYQGDYVLNYINNVAIKGGKLFSLHGTASYRRRILDLPTVFRLNVRNLVRTDYVTMGAVRLSNGTIRNLHAYGDPRSATLTATVEF